MTIAIVSPTGRITIPASLRKLAHIQPGTRIMLIMQDEEIILKPLKSLRELEGIFAEHAHGHEESNEEIRRQVMEAVAKEVMDEGQA